MYIEYQCSGGFGGLHLAYQGETDTLPAAEAAEAVGVLTTEPSLLTVDWGFRNFRRPAINQTLCTRRGFAFKLPGQFQQQQGVALLPPLHALHPEKFIGGVQIFIRAAEAETHRIGAQFLEKQ